MIKLHVVLFVLLQGTYLLGTENRTFLDWCTSSENPASIRETVEAVFSNLDTRDCKEAERRLQLSDHLELQAPQIDLNAFVHSATIVHTLSLRGEIVSLPLISEFQFLQNLEVYISEHEDLQYLSKIKYLKSLFIRGRKKVDIEQWPPLFNKSAVRVLSIQSVGKVGNFASLDFPELERLEFIDTQVSSLDFNNHFPKLKWLNVSFNSTIADFSFIEKFSGLESLILSVTKVANLTFLSSLDHLKELQAYGTKIKDILPLGGLRNLRVLVLFNNEIEDLSPLSPLVQLEVGMVFGNPIHKSIKTCPTTNVSEVIGRFCRKYLQQSIIEQNDRCVLYD